MKIKELFIKAKTLVTENLKWEKIKSLRHISRQKIYLILSFLVVVFVSYHFLTYIKNSFVDSVIKVMMGSKRIMVTVTPATEQTIPVYFKYVGNTDSMRTVDIRARVEGFLNQRNFVEGADVNEGDLLFVIDPAPFQAALEQKQAKLAKDQAQLEYDKKELERYRPLVEKEYITRESFDKYETSVAQDEAVVKADQADLDTATLNLSYCSMYAPFSGRIGKTKVDVGNFVGGGGKDTVLATLVQLDPIYVYFSPSDRELHQILEAQNKGMIPVSINFSDGTTFPHEGKLDFVNNVVDQSTSTVKMRAIIPNPEKTILPGVYVNTTLSLGETSGALLVPEKAITESQSGKTVMVVDPDGEVDQRKVETANTYQGMTVITKGLKVGEYVVTEGIQRVRDGISVAFKVNQAPDLSKKED